MSKNTMRKKLKQISEFTKDIEFSINLGDDCGATPFEKRDKISETLGRETHHDVCEI